MAKTPNLDELRGQARSSYRYWHIYLMLRLREVEQHLTPAEKEEVGMVQQRALPKRRRGRGVYRDPH